MKNGEVKEILKSKGIKVCNIIKWKWRNNHNEKKNGEKGKLRNLLQLQYFLIFNKKYQKQVDRMEFNIIPSNYKKHN